MAFRRGVMKGSRAPGRAFPLPIALLIALSGLSVVASAWTIPREYDTQLAERRFEDQTTLLETPGQAQDIAVDTPSQPTARLLAADTLFLAREAASLPPGAKRDALLARAEQQAANALQDRPRWGETWVIAAFMASLRSPPALEAERQALIRAYADAPFLEKSGYWRIERALAQWDALPPSTRYRVIDETAWLLRRGDAQNRTRLFNLVRASPAYRPVFIRWRELAKEAP